MTDGEIIQEAVRLVREGHDVTLKVRGRSMLPFIVGDRDSVMLSRAGLISVGDVVLAEVAGGRYVIHRIIRINGERVVLMGDGNLAGTEQCRLSDVKALATHVVSDGGRQRWLYSRRMRWAANVWRRLHPVRRYLLYIYRKLNQL